MPGSSAGFFPPPPPAPALYGLLIAHEAPPAGRLRPGAPRIWSGAFDFNTFPRPARLRCGGGRYFHPSIRFATRRRPGIGATADLVLSVPQRSSDRLPARCQSSGRGRFPTGSAPEFLELAGGAEYLVRPIRPLRLFGNLDRPAIDVPLLGAGGGGEPGVTFHF